MKHVSSESQKAELNLNHYKQGITLINLICEAV